MGGGHDATAAALEESVRRQWPGSELQRLDILDVMGRGVGAAFRSIYVTNVESTPWLYEFFYASLWRHRWFANASRRFTGSWCGRRLASRIDRFDPDAILTTHPIASTGVAWLHRHRGLDVPSAAWVSDFSPHPFWLCADLDLTFVVHDAALPVARAAEPHADVRVSGLPVRRAFTPGDGAAARRSLGLRQDAFVVLVATGAYAFGDVESMVRSIASHADGVQVVVACGRDEATLRRVRALGLPAEQVLTLGWTEDMVTVLRSADLVIGNAGGATALEALATRRRLLMAAPIAAHGAANAALMEVAGVSETVLDAGRVGEVVATLAGSRDEARAELHDHELGGASRGGASLGGASRGGASPGGASPGGASPGGASPGGASLGGASLDGASLDGVDGDLDAAVAMLPVVHAAHRSPGAGHRRRHWPMRPADAFFTHVEEPGLHQDVGAELELDPPPGGMDVEKVRAAVHDRTRGLALLRRVRRAEHLAWELQDHVDVDTHVREVKVRPGAPAEEFRAALDDFWSTPLDPDLPAWRYGLVHQDSPPRAVLAVEMHHSQADGVSALGLQDRLMDTAPDDPLTERRPGGPGHGRRAGVRAIAEGLWHLATRGPVPRHPIRNVEGSGRRQLVRVPMALDQLQSLAERFGARPHEVVLALVADALPRALGPAGLLLPDRPLRAMVPVAVRAPRFDRVFGNWTGALAVDLPVGAGSFGTTLELLQQELRRRASRHEAEAAAAVMWLAGQLPPRLHRWFVRAVYQRRFFTTVVSYMPGPRRGRWVGGARVRAVYPVLPLAKGVPLTVGAVVADGTVGLAVLIDPALRLHPDALEVAFVSAIDDALGS
jgi:UDP-N-acetylglucosamine:LPS N-acetylglucosamine transferase